jgi:NAD-dependent deacetylase|nr:Sir2 family NAD-dependent protein deacetylase [Neorhizobium tomejilense]
MAVIISGAGLSADSGVPTFFGANGSYGRFANPEDVVSSGTLKKDPELLHRFVDDMRVALGNAEPNEAHRMIARLAGDYSAAFEHITQNIDDLVERAGFHGSIHLHGFLTRMRQLLNPAVTEDIGYSRYWDGDPSLAPPRGFQFRSPDRHKSRYRPDVVLFGEPAPEYAALFTRLDINGTKHPDALGPDDLVVVIGTRGAVIPIQPFLSLRRCKSVLVNLHYHEEIMEDLFDTVIHDRASEAAPVIEQMVRSHLGEPTTKSASPASL